MSKELPYFKFFVNEWITGDITLEDYEVQGLFVNICAYYWSKECKITLTNAKRKFKNISESAFDSLIDSQIIKVDKDDYLVIKFLDEQNIDRAHQRVTNSKNGKKGGRPPKAKTENKPNGLISESETKAKPKAKKSNIEKRREDKSIVSIKETIQKKENPNTRLPLKGTAIGKNFDEETKRKRAAAFANQCPL